MKTSIRLISLFFVSFLLVFSAYAADIYNYDNVSNADEALRIIKENRDLNAILISPASFEPGDEVNALLDPASLGQAGQKVIKINRGSADYFYQVGILSKSTWTNIIAPHKNPHSLSVSQLIDELSYVETLRFATDSGIYELSIHNKTWEIKLSGESSGFEVRTLSDGSFLILLGKKSPPFKTAFSVVM